MKLFKKGEKFSAKRAIALVLIAAMLAGYVPASWGYQALAATAEFGKVSDPETLTRPVDVFAGTTANAGRILVGKSVASGGVDFSGEAANAVWQATDPENFIVTISQSAQSMGISSEIPVPVDAVFVLDTSGSMAFDIDSTQENNVARADQRATHMVKAANDAIASLLAANPLNRVAVVGFSGDVTELSSLYSYTGSAAEEHLQWVNSEGNVSGTGNYIAGRNTDGTRGEYRNGKEGGTNIHAGIAAGAQILAEAENTTVTINGKEVTRIPFLIVLSDGAPTYSSTSEDWKNPGTGLQGPGSSSYVGNGFLPVLTASYYKNVVSKHYFGNNVTDNNRAYMYTIGVGVDGLDGNDEELALITLNPKDNFTATSTNKYSSGNDGENFKNYWAAYQAGTADFDVIVDYVQVSTGQGGGRPGSGRPQYTWQYQTYTVKQGTIDSSVTSLAYNDNYYSAGNASQLNAAFRSIVVEIQKRAIAYPTLTSETMTDDFSGYVTFRDVIGEYMEVKDVLGVTGDGNLYQGLQFAKYMDMTQAEVDADPKAQAFMENLIHSMEVRFGLRLPEQTDKVHGSMGEWLEDAWNWAHDRDADGNVYTDGTANPRTQMYYDEATGQFDNSICWWGHTASDGAVQHMGFAADDSIEYIEAAKEMAAAGETYRAGVGTAVPEGADYVARSYFYYGTAGGTVEDARDYLDLSITVIRELEAPYRQTVVISAPASLLALQRVLIYDTDKDGKITAYFDELVPTRVVYEVGLRDDITPESAEGILSEEYKAANRVDGGYVFYTNEWNRDAAEGEAMAMTSATFTSDSGNEYYAFDANTPIYVKDGDSYVLYDDPSAERPVGKGFYYAHEYYEWDASATAAQGAAGVPCSAVKVKYIELDIPEETGQIVWDSLKECWVIKAGTYKAHSLISNGIEIKTRNLTETAPNVAYPVRTGTETEPHYAVYLGNNGKLTFATVDPKTVTNESGADVDGLAVMVGEKLTYHIQVTNTYEAAADATITDRIPEGTVLVADSVRVWNGSSELAADKYTFTNTDGVLSWVFEDIPAGETYVAEFKVEITLDALTVDAVTNQAEITLGGNSYRTNVVTNPAQGKSVTGATSTVVPGDGVQVGDELVYTIQYYNDTDSTADVKIVDQIPAGTEYVAGTATSGGTLSGGVLTWTIRDVAAGTGGTVSFKVAVTAAALTNNPFTNTATIQIGDNAPQQSTNEVETDIKVGDLILSKEIRVDSADEGLNPDLNRAFTLVLTDTTGKLNAAAETFSVVDETGAEVSKITFDADSQAKVTIRHDQTLTVKGLPVGVTIVVTEELEDGSGYIVSYPSGNSATIVENNDTVAAAGVAVINTYEPVPTDDLWKLDYINFYKELVSNGSALSDKTFTFVAHPATETGELSHERSSVVHGSVVVSSGGTVKIEFDELRFAETGTYYFLITETIGSAGGMTYDTSEFLLKVEVFDDGSGKLKIKEDSIALKVRANASGTWSEDAAVADGVFTNTYTPASAAVNLSANKILNNLALAGDDFTFEVVDANGNVVVTAKNAADGTVTFPEFTVDKPGEHTYTIREANGGRRGFTYDSRQFTVTVKVSDDGAGQLSAAVVYDTSDGKAPVFENTYTPDPITVVLEADKKLTGRRMIAGEFTFTLTGTDGTSLTAKNDAAGNVIFDAIGYTIADAGKTYTYTIREAEGTDSSITYSDEVITVTVSVTYDQASGALSAAIGYPGDVEIENIFNPPAISVTPEAVKITRNLAFGDKTFSFSLVKADGSVVATGTSGINGAVRFTVNDGELSFDQAGSYYYWMQEIGAGSTVDGITYDDAIYVMAVEVTADPVTGLLSYTAEYGVVGAVGQTEYTTAYGEAVFTNVYEAAEGTLIIVADKVLNGRPINAGEFEFTLTEVGGTYTETVKSGENGIIVFSEIKYEKAGTYTYQIIERTGDLGGVAYDDTVYTVTVSVTDDSAGKLHAAITGVKKDGAAVANKAIVFTNSYTPASTTIQLGAEGTVDITKELNGRPMDDGEFSFLLELVGGTYTDTKTNQSGRVVFDTITYTEAGTYVYTISEIAGDVPGVTYNTSQYTVTVTVTDNLKGQLTAAVTGVKKDGVAVADGKTVEFVNTYVPVETTAHVEATKNLTGRDQKAGEFSFVLEDEDGHKIYATNDGEGNIRFRDIVYDKAGEYTYTVYEMQGNLAGVEYDKKSFTVTVKITDDLNGKLTAEVQYPAGGITFGNTYSAEGTSLRLTATKTLTGRDLAADEFRFEAQEVLADGSLGEVKALGWNDTKGNVVFNAIVFDAVGEYTYRVYEVEGDLGGVKYDDRYYTVVIEVLDSGSGKLTASVKSVADESGTEVADKSIAFSNTYAPAPTTIQLGAEGTLDIIKNLIGRELQAGEFTFVLSGSGENLTAGNDENGKVVFDEITYTGVGEYTYTIREAAGPADIGVSYTTDEYTVTVTVTDNLKGQLVAEVADVKLGGKTVSEKAAEFTNTYTTGKTTITLEALKELIAEVRELGAEEFAFTLVGDDGTNLTAKNDADGKIVFPEIEYDFADAGKTYTYVISEVRGDLPGMTYDRSEYIVTVEVADDGKGNLSAKATYPAGGVKFVNTYAPGATSIQLEATKVLEVLAGELTLKDVQFSFYLAEQLSNGTYLLTETMSNDANGRVIFSAISFTQAGTYTYAIGESAGNNKGVTYDNSWYEVIVEVTDDGQGNLTAGIKSLTVVKGDERTELEAGAALEFVNIYEAAPVDVQIHAGKELVGKELEDKAFEFLLESEDGTFGDVTGFNDADGNISFDLKFTETGTYRFTLSEKPGSDGNITYDGHEYIVTVEVTDDGEGSLRATVVYGTETGEAPVFVNTYIPEEVSVKLEGKKTLTGRDLVEGEFGFILEDAKGNRIQVTHDAAGNLLFPTLLYREAGTHTYRVYEVAGDDSLITYDQTVLEVTVTVTDRDGVLEAEVQYPEGGISFFNAYRLPEAPDSGDHAQMVLWAMAAVLSAAAVVTLVVVRKKALRREEE